MQAKFKDDDGRKKFGRRKKGALERRLQRRTGELPARSTRQMEFFKGMLQVLVFT